MKLMYLVLGITIQTFSFMKSLQLRLGIIVNIVSGKDKALQKRITEEGKDSKADLYITADAGRLGAFRIERNVSKRSYVSKAIKAVSPFKL